jgi:hypothetical protein
MSLTVERDSQNNNCGLNTIKAPFSSNRVWLSNSGLQSCSSSIFWNWGSSHLWLSGLEHIASMMVAQFFFSSTAFSALIQMVEANGWRRVFRAGLLGFIHILTMHHVCVSFLWKVFLPMLQKQYWYTFLPMRHTYVS